jgi:hypothetical protein
MKHLKEFEKHIPIDFDKIYVYSYNYFKAIGKLRKSRNINSQDYEFYDYYGNYTDKTYTETTPNFNFNIPLENNYITVNGNRVYHITREATPYEITHYEIGQSRNKYNL